MDILSGIQGTGPPRVSAGPGAELCDVTGLRIRQDPREPQEGYPPLASENPVLRAKENDD